jgi:lipid-A-disaccharide synthase
MATPVFFLIAGEASGDLLGARLMRQLCIQMDGNVRFVGIGGPHMVAEGLDLLFPHTELMHFGIIEVLRHIPRLLSHINQTAREVIRVHPLALITIDSPDFCFRVAQRVKRNAPTKIPLIHYVAPTVWAWRPGRAKKIAKFLDHLLAVLPFEPPYFTRAGLPCTFVGHSVVEGDAANGSNAMFRAAHHIPLDTPLLTVLPGSRVGEITRLLPIFRDTVKILQQNHKDFHIVVPTVPHIRARVAAEIATWGIPFHIVESERDKYDAFAASRAALACSGTVALELALAKLPAVIAYKINALTVLLYRRLIRVRFANLVNIMHDKEVVPEFLQENCTPDKLAAGIDTLLRDETVRQEQITQLAATAAWLGHGQFVPSERAAETVLQVIQQNSSFPRKRESSATSDSDPGEHMSPLSQQNPLPRGASKPRGFVGFEHSVRHSRLATPERAALDSRLRGNNEGEEAPHLPTVLQVVPALVTGGVERGTVETAAALVKKGFRAVVASSGGPMVREVEAVGGTHITLPLASKNPFMIWHNIGSLNRVIREQKIDIVHARSRAPAWSAFFAARRTCTPFVTTFHSAYGAKPALKRWYNSVMAKGARVIAISDFVAVYAEMTYTISHDIMRTIPRGVDSEKFDPARINPERIAALRSAWNVTHSAPLILMPGRLTRKKGQLVLIQALAKLERRDFICIIVGGGKDSPFGKEVARAIHKAGLERNVSLVDICRDMPAAYSLADIVVVPSTQPEGFGRVAIEAQAMGTPVIASNHGGATETIIPGETGWLTAPNDAKALAQAIDAVLNMSNAQRQAFATHATTHIRTHFTTEAMTTKTLAVYQELLQRR